MAQPDPNPAQERVTAQLLERDAPRPTIDPSLHTRLRDDLRAELAGPLELLEMRDEQLFLTKHVIATVLGCEERWQTGDVFEWTVATAVGTVTHKAAELLLVGKLDASPAEAVEAAVDTLVTDASGDGLGRFLDLASAAQIADLRARATTSVTSLVDGFPAISPRWHARAEQSYEFGFENRRITLRARPDLALGRPAGPQARVLLIDFKTGRPTHTDLEDGRFYALVHTLRWGVPPWRVATFYVNDSTWSGEDVDEALLRAASRRTADAVVRMTQIIAGERKPTLTPGPACRWCAIRETCPGAVTWREQAKGDESEVPF